MSPTKIPTGYKQTEVGVIPEDWDSCCLGDKTIKIGSGITPTGGEKVYKQEGRPFLRSQNVGWGILVLDDIAFIDDEIHETFRSTEIHIDDVFLNITGASIGRSAVADNRVVKGNVNQHVCIIRTDKEQLNPRFLNYFLLSSAGQRQIDSFQAGGNRQGLNFGQIRSFYLPLPFLPEQVVIAEALSDIDALISSLEKLIAKKRAIKQGTMQELLTGKRRLPGFSGKWEVNKLKELCDLNKGSQINKSKLTETGKYLVWNGGIEPSSYTENWNTRENTITISEGGNSCGFVNYCIQKFWCGGHCYAVQRIKESINQLFFYQKLKHTQTIIMGLRVGSGLPNIQKKNLLSLELYLPKDKAEQTAIAQVLSDMDAEIENLDQQLAKYKMLKQGMMQVLLTGRIRLV